MRLPYVSEEPQVAQNKTAFIERKNFGPTSVYPESDQKPATEKFPFPQIEKRVGAYMAMVEWKIGICKGRDYTEPSL